jgi:hypothetical protein
MGDGRTYEYLCGIRLVSSTDYMTADWYRIDWEVLARSATTQSSTGCMHSELVAPAASLNQSYGEAASPPVAPTVPWGAVPLWKLLLTLWLVLLLSACGCAQDIQPDHQRGPRHQPLRLRLLLQAACHHRVGVGALRGPDRRPCRCAACNQLRHERECTHFDRLGGSPHGG